MSAEDVEYFIADVVSAREEIRRIGSISYPYGIACPALAAGVMPGRSFDVGGYRYGFQGQEFDSEWLGEGNAVSYKFRVADARLGRFFSVDPLAQEYPWNSTYAFSENEVIRAIELEGLEKWERIHQSGYKNARIN